MESLISAALARLVRTGTLKVTFASGRTRVFGDGTEAPVAIRLSDKGAERALALDPALKLGELFMDGRLIVEAGSIYDLVSLVKRNGLRRLRAPHVALIALYRSAQSRIAAQSTPEGARRNVAHHYDLDAGLFELFLDADRQYSCAYFETPEQSLEDAQLAKKRHIAAKLLLEPDLHVLDIGSGWGGLALYLARIGRRPRHRHHALGEAARDRAAPRERTGPRRTRRVSACGLSAHRGAVRPYRVGRHVRACRPAELSRASSQRPPRC